MEGARLGIVEDNDRRGNQKQTESSNVAGDFHSGPIRYRQRKNKALSGPDARIGTGLESAITRAMREAPSRGAKPVFYPRIGTTFNSCVEAKEFYNLFSWEMGFGVRFNRSRTNPANYRTKMNIVCSCEGRPKIPNSASIRTGCKAMIRVRRTKDHGWFVTKFVEAHNHPLSDCCGENQQWPSHGQIDPGTKDFIRRLRDNNVPIGQVCSILGTRDGSTGPMIRKEVIRSLCAKIAQENIRDDIVKTQALLDEMKNADPDMDVRCRVDKEGRIQSMLWCTGKNREQYSKFGDVVTFDTTYRTNLYNMPFGLFIGVNNHFQSTVFGGVLLTSEKTEDFEWAFSTFLKIMGGKAPQTFLTDQCAAMESALRTSIPTARHRWCRWHVLKKAKDYLGHVYSKYSTFKKEFHTLITDVTDKRDFELQWIALLKRYKLQGNRYLKRIFKKRAKWAKPYFMGVFCAGMTSTQRSESANHMLKRFIPRSAPMHQFVKKFSEFQFDRQGAADKEKHFTKQVPRETRFNFPIENHAKKIYTRAMYERFSQELFESGGYAIDHATGSENFVLVHTSQDNHPGANSTKVTFKLDRKRIDCECGMYGHIGMLCRHSLKVLVHLDSRHIPEGNVMERWKKDESLGFRTRAIHTTRTHLGGDARRTLLIKRAMELANSTDISDESLVSVIEAMEAAKGSTPPQKKKRLNAIEITEGIEAGVTLKCPLRPVRKGRPAGTSLKSWNRSVRKKTMSKPIVDREMVGTSEDEDNPPGGRTRSVHELVSRG